jgi:DMSO/TMAO reductase YedYZ molybdopterin-dependent catalytic subunit
MPQLPPLSPDVSRRDFLRVGLAWGGLASLGAGAAPSAQCVPAPLGDLVRLVRLQGDRAYPTPLGELVGGPGLDARQFTDLSRLAADRLITPQAEVFVRTTAPASVRPTPPTWRIGVSGLAARATPLELDELRRLAVPMGAHLIECAGNADPDNFGLMSVAEWDGVPLASLADRLQPGRTATGVLVSGLDDHPSVSRTSNPGAAWVLPLDALARLGAFLAVRMNGDPLTPDHGAPVRLVVPGWYGCSWIKWVDTIRLVGADEPATTQMQEFSRRTHQDGVPTRAREYTPPAIDLAATPIRVEQRRIDGRLAYRVVGIVWGGERPVDHLAIRFGSRGTPTPFPVCPPPTTHRTWSLWEYWWRPTEPGSYVIALTATDRSIRTRRLDLSYYIRRVVIDEV